MVFLLHMDLQPHLYLMEKTCDAEWKETQNEYKTTDL